jgi:2-keto-myo-inositol isomerase
VLVDAQDRLGNIPQIRTLVAAGYTGPFSFEPFSEEVQAIADPAPALKASMDYIAAGA